MVYRVPGLERKGWGTGSIDGLAYYAVDFGVRVVCVFGEEGVEVGHFCFLGRYAWIPA